MESTSKFTNWCENISNPSRIYYPKNDHEIITLIQLAKQKQKPIRVVGSTHSISPVVCDSKEDLILISMKDYHLSQDIVIDHNLKRVTVNAGWTLGKLYDELNRYHYFLDTQPASPAFTVGGVVSMPVHGSRLGASLIADSVIAMTFINQDGLIVQKNYEDSDFNMYRLNLGIIGIVTSVTFNVLQIKNIKATLETHNNVFLPDGKINRTAVEDKFKELISACFRSDIHYHHSFMDFHNNVWLTIDWTPNNEPSFISFDTPEPESVPKIGIDEVLHDHILPHYRKNRDYLKLLGKIYRFGITTLIQKNLLEDKDMFWVYIGTRVFFMSYMIPVYTEGQPMDLTRLYSALEAIMEEVKKVRPFNIDLPADIRFVVSNTNSIASPIANSQRTIYLAIDLTCGPANLNLTLKSSRCEIFDCLFFSNDDKELNADFRKFFSSVEQKWKYLGGVPQYSKLFGFGGSKNNPFDPHFVRQVFPNDIKQLLRIYAQPQFMNNFIRTLLS